MDSSSGHDPKQASHTKPTIEEMKKWDEKELLKWIQKQEPTPLNDDKLEKFKNASIDGVIFLKHAGDKTFFQKECDLPIGTSDRLADLASEIANSVEGSQSNQTAGRKRKADEMDAPEPSISMEIDDEPEVLLEIAAKAREQRKRIKEVITVINDSSDQHSNSIEPANPLAGAVDQHSNSIEPANPLAGAVDRLSDPTLERMLPFPFVGSKAPARFKLVEENWQYMGRTKFKELVQEVKEIQKSTNFHTVWLYGTQGYGKSHLLAALVCYLTARDERVVYIPDCRAFLDDPVEYLQEAMLFAWADDIAIQKFIITLKTLGEIKEFFKNKKNVIFVIDQMNALKPDGSEEERAQREEVSRWIKRLTFRHDKVYSSSANNSDFHKHIKKENQSRLLSVYGGLTEAEMNQWWKRHSDIDRGDYEKSDIEDVTGRIPLLLDKCVVGKKIDLTVGYLSDLYDNAEGFTQLVKEKNSPSRWKWYYDYVTACLCHKNVPGGRNAHLDLIDHRYFYDIDGQGWYTCSLIRDAVTDQLLTWNEDFADTDFLTSLSSFIDNRSVSGFMIEHAVLSSIRSNGLAISGEIRKAMHARLLLSLDEINTDITGTAVLYRPKKSNFKAIDGMIVLIEPGKNDAKKKLLLFPLQITLTPNDHKDPRTEFFEEYGWWVTSHSDFDVEVQFLWITPICRDIQEYPASENPKWSKHLERYIPFWDVNHRIWEKYEKAQKGLPQTKADLQKLEKNKGSSIKAVPERAVSTRVAAKEATTKIAASESATAKKPAAKKTVAKTTAAKTAAKKAAAKAAKDAKAAKGGTS